MEFKEIRRTMTSSLIVLSAIWAIWSFFYSGTWSTYLATYFTVRSRALSSLISPFFCMSVNESLPVIVVNFADEVF